MLQIKDIRKQYVTGELVQTALDGVSLNLREQELVAILGPSGSGKSTLLNVIGGLDRYDSGDLIIDGISTKKYNDRDWDSYRNHTIGFIFQSYNLIPHQTVLANVELALTISGIPAAERKRRAIKALEEVGLGNQIHKKPNQMSGGQMQRVAIARALVNNPKILLADEPTGALDSETSIQVMELLKEVAKDRLVVMVTHNPDLAYQYATRIVKVKDGRIIDDSNPYPVDETGMEPPRHRNLGKASMGFRSALMLSFNNLRTKKGRTLLTAFAGSIGIIGIALILSLSAGFQNYIDQIQEDTLASYPLTIQSESADMSGAFASMMMMGMGGKEGEPGTVSEVPMLAKMFTHVGNNDLASFKAHLEANEETIGHSYSAVQYGYGIKPRIYANNFGTLQQVNPATLFKEITGNDTLSALMDYDAFQELLEDQSLLDAQYQVLQGHWPRAYNELVFILPSATRLPDQIAYTLGMLPMDNLSDMAQQLRDGEDVVLPDSHEKWTYDDIMGMTFQLVSNPDLYRYNPEYKIWEDMSGDEAFLENAVAQGETLKVVGIVCPKEGSSATSLMPGIGFDRSLTEHLVEVAAQSEIVQQQLADREVDVFSGKRFDDPDSDAGLNFQDMISVDTKAITSAFGMDISPEDFEALIQQALNEIAGAMNVDTSPAKRDFLTTLTNFSRRMLNDYHTAHADENGVARVSLADVEPMVTGFLNTKYAQDQMWDLARAYSVPQDTFYQVYQPLLAGMVTAHIAHSIATDILPPSHGSAPMTAPTTETEVPEPTVSETTVPEPTVSETTVPEPTVSETTVPEPTVSETTVPPSTLETESETPLPSETQPEGTQPGETQPGETQPGETQPGETQPGETQPGETQPGETQPGETQPDVTQPVDPSAPTGPEESLPDETVPTVPEIPTPGDLYADFTAQDIDGMVLAFTSDPIVSETAEIVSAKMMEATVMQSIIQRLSGMDTQVARLIQRSMRVDGGKIAGAFHFNMNEEELQRIFTAMSSRMQERTVGSNLRSLDYAEFDKPVYMAVYMSDFAGKEEFIDFLDTYNEDMESSGQENKVIQYTDMTGTMMASMKTIINAVSYVLIAFVGVSLVVSSIMIGIITYISVMERTKEIGILRAMGASKHNISQVFNAETFIIGLCSGALGIGVTLALLIPGNQIIHHLVGNSSITAALPVVGAIVLILLSMGLTLLGGLIPSKQAAKKDPVIALRSE